MNASLSESPVEPDDWIEFAADHTTLRYHSDSAGLVWLCVGTREQWLPGGALSSGGGSGQPVKVASPDEAPRWAVHAAYAISRLFAASLTIALFWLVLLGLLYLSKEVRG